MKKIIIADIGFNIRKFLFFLFNIFNFQIFNKYFNVIY